MHTYTSALASAGLFLIVLILWQQSSGAAHANETKEMGGTSFEGEPSSSYQDLRAFITRYHLSEREGQVLSLWISGRDVPYICDELFIAKNTVKTHLKHIYEKTGVTGKQELINLALS